MGLGKTNSRYAVEAYRDAVNDWRRGIRYDTKPSTHSFARAFGIQVGDLHESAGCRDGKNCTGQQCRL